VTNFPTKVLLAIDDSEEVEPATRRAIDLADTADSELHIIYVGQLPNFLMNDPDIMGFYRKLYDDIEQESLEILWRLTWEVKAAGGDVAGSHLGMGVVDLEIVVLAKELGADLIVMGCRGHRGIRRAIEGSISDAVIRHAPCPVLVVRSHESAQDPKWPALFAGGR
jgi:nucleotide-binding universal stress UspA family protein